MTSTPRAAGALKISSGAALEWSKPDARLRASQSRPFCVPAYEKFHAHGARDLHGRGADAAAGAVNEDVSCSRPRRLKQA